MMLVLLDNDDNEVASIDYELDRDGPPGEWSDGERTFVLEGRDGDDYIYRELTS